MIVMKYYYLFLNINGDIKLYKNKDNKYILFFLGMVRFYCFGGFYIFNYMYKVLWLCL